MDDGPAVGRGKAVKRSGLKLRGVNHLALVTDDMGKTVEFYADVLNIRLVPARTDGAGVSRGNSPFEPVRPYFFDMGNDESLAFFELPKRTRRPTARGAIGGMQHASFTASRAIFEEVRRRLEVRGIPILGPITILGGRALSMYFRGPDDIRLELTCHLAEDEDPNVIADMTMTKRAARAELLTLHDDPAWIERMIAHLPD